MWPASWKRCCMCPSKTCCCNWRRRLESLAAISTACIFIRPGIASGDRNNARPAKPSGEELDKEPDQQRAAMVLFYSLLDEQQRRLYAGLESLKQGHGGDRQLAQILGLDEETVARGRQQLLEAKVQRDRVRQPGGGRPRAAK